jgi:glycosyltransferase EpsF
MNDKHKVLQILGGVGFGGAETFIMNQFRNLNNEYLFDFAVQVKYDCSVSYENDINSLGGKIFYLGLFRQSPYRFYKSIIEVIKSNGPYDAIHIHINEQCGVAAYAAKKAGIKRIICHAHSSNYGQNNILIKSVMLWANKMLVNRVATNLLACSQEAGEMFFGKTPRRVLSIVKNPIFVSKYECKKNSQIRDELGVDNELILIHIGRFIEVKNHEFIIQIAKKLKDDNIQFKMILVGNGKMQLSIRNLINYSSLSGNVVLLGERSDIPDLLGISDLLLLPSKYEGLPTVVLEAQATGIPSIVSSNVSNICDLGLGLVSFLPIDDPEIWSTHIVALRGKRINDRKQISEAFLNNGISIDTVSGELVKIYTEKI